MNPKEVRLRKDLEKRNKDLKTLNDTILERVRILNHKVNRVTKKLDKNDKEQVKIASQKIDKLNKDYKTIQDKLEQAQNNQKEIEEFIKNINITPSQETLPKIDIHISSRKEEEAGVKIGNLNSRLIKYEDGKDYLVIGGNILSTEGIGEDEHLLIFMEVYDRNMKQITKDTTEFLNTPTPPFLFSVETPIENMKILDMVKIYPEKRNINNQNLNYRIYDDVDNQEESIEETIEENLEENIEENIEENLEENLEEISTKKDIQEIDINTATQEQITQIPNITLIQAKKIIQLRENGEYIKSLNDLAQKLNLKPYEIEEIKPYIKIVKKIPLNSRKLDL